MSQGVSDVYLTITSLRLPCLPVPEIASPKSSVWIMSQWEHTASSSTTCHGLFIFATLTDTCLMHTTALQAYCHLFYWSGAKTQIGPVTCPRETTLSGLLWGFKKVIRRPINFGSLLPSPRCWINVCWYMIQLMSVYYITWKYKIHVSFGIYLAFLSQISAL